MSNVFRGSYSTFRPDVGSVGLLPLLSFQLHTDFRSVQVSGLLDTGSTVNVLPYELGVQLGFDWEQQTTSLHLTGNLARFEARAVLAKAVIGSFLPVPMAFAWTTAKEVPLILGQTNFFQEFDVCFYRSQKAFELRRKRSGTASP